MPQCAYDLHLQALMDCHQATWTPATADLHSVANIITMFEPRLREVCAVIEAMADQNPRDPDLCAWRQEQERYLDYLGWARELFQGCDGYYWATWHARIYQLMAHAVPEVR